MKLMGGLAAIVCALILTAGCSSDAGSADGTQQVYAGNFTPEPPTDDTSTPPAVESSAPVYVPPTTAAPVEKVRLKAKGQGAKTTKTFTVALDQWTIGYAYNCGDSQGNFQIYVYKSDGTIAGVGANALDTDGNDVTYEHGAGSYYLMVNTSCAWRIRVVG